LDILTQADNLKEKRQTRYNIAKWASYVLYTLGWGLAFYGQLSGKDNSASEIKT